MARKTAPVIEEDEDELELEELDEDEAEEAPKRTRAKAKPAQEEVWGVRNLIELIETKTGKEYNPRQVRTLLRTMARDGKGRIEREIVPGNKTRYAWSGPTDPEVKRILKAVSGGEIEAAKNAALAKLKEDRAAKIAAEAAAGGKKGVSKQSKAVGKRKTKAAPVVEEDDDLEEFEDDD
jgi:hypothetical protein